MLGLMRVPPIVTGALICAVALLAGCGSSEPKPVFDHDAVLRLEIGDFTISPQVVEIRAVTTPTIVRIVAKNIGHLTHNVHIEQASSSAKSISDADFGGTPTAHPGETVRSGYIFLLPGKYRLTCTIANHDNLGQHGSLIVDPPTSGQ